MWSLLAHRGFAQLWQPAVLLTVLGLETAYLLVIGPLRRRIPGATAPSWRQILSFSLGMATLYVAVGSPLDYLADHVLFTAHMTEHVILAMFTAPLVLLGTPAWFWRGLLHRPSTRAVFRGLTHPVTALLLFNGVLTLLHFPIFVQAGLEHEYIHVLEHGVLLFVSLLMWWPIFSPLPESPRLSAPLQMLYFFVDSIAITLICAYLLFIGKPLYPYYLGRTEALGLTPYADQQMAAALMKLTTEVIYGIGVLVNFYRWTRDYARRERPGLAASEPLLLRTRQLFGIRGQVVGVEPAPVIPLRARRGETGDGTD